MYCQNVILSQTPSGEEEEEDYGGSDDDDTSWKVRKAAVRLIAAVIASRTESLKYMYVILSFFAS